MKRSKLRYLFVKVHGVLEFWIQDMDPDYSAEEGMYPCNEEEGR